LSRWLGLGNGSTLGKQDSTLWHAHCWKPGILPGIHELWRLVALPCVPEPDTAGKQRAGPELFQDPQCRSRAGTAA